MGMVSLAVAITLAVTVVELSVVVVKEAAEEGRLLVDCWFPPFAAAELEAAESDRPEGESRSDEEEEEEEEVGEGELTEERSEFEEEF